MSSVDNRKNKMFLVSVWTGTHGCVGGMQAPSVQSVQVSLPESLAALAAVAASLSLHPSLTLHIPGPPLLLLPAAYPAAAMLSGCYYLITDSAAFAPATQVASCPDQRTSYLGQCAAQVQVGCTSKDA